MMNDEALTGRQLALELTPEAERLLPESAAEKLVEALQEILLLAETAIAQRSAQETADED